MKKLTPLIILLAFGIGVYLMKQGMDNAINLAQPQSTQSAKILP